MKELLIITNYYPPETGAASNRIAHLAEGFAERGYAVKVITPLPNYPYGRIFKKFRGKIKDVSTRNGVKIVRLWLYASNSKSLFKRLLAMLSFSMSLSLHLLFSKNPKTIIIQSPPLLVAFTSIFWLRSRKRKIILNVSDLWPLAGKELGVFDDGFQYKLLKGIEAYNYRKADIVFGQSNEILDHIRAYKPPESLVLYRNFPKLNSTGMRQSSSSEKIRLVYAGLLGVAQGIVRMCSELEYSGIELHIYGAGAEKEELERFIEAHSEFPIFYHGEIKRSELHQILPSYDLVLIPLLNRIYGSVPSKIFEYGKLGLPMIYFGGGEGEELIEKYDLGWVVEAGNYKALNKTIQSIGADKLDEDMRARIRKTSEEAFDFERQFEDIIKWV